jgi:predicted Zn-dependent peptidase
MNKTRKGIKGKSIKGKSLKGKSIKGKSRSKKSKMENIKFYNKAPELLEINGYKLVILPVNSKVTLIECILLGGFYFEKKENCGISHLLEHIITTAWKKCKLNGCNVYWEKYGINSNAHTSISTNRYWIKGITDIFDKMLEYIIEIIINPKFNESVIEKEKKAVENELNKYLNKQSWKLGDTLNKNLYTIEGMRYSEDKQQQLKILKLLTKKKLVNHFKEYYTKNNILFIISSNLEKQLIINKFHKLTKSTKPIKLTNRVFEIKKPLCFQDKKKIIFVNNPTSKNTDIKICFPFNIYIGDKDQTYIGTISNIIAGDLTSLLLKILREKLKLVYGISCSFMTNMCGTVVFLSVSTLDKNIKKVLEIVFKICKKYSNKLISNNKLLQLKRKMKMSIYELNLNSVEAVRNFYASQYLYQLNDKNRKIITLNEKIKKINSLTKGKIKDLIKRIFDTKNCLIVYQGKQKTNFNYKKPILITKNQF